MIKTRATEIPIWIAIFFALISALSCSRSIDTSAGDRLVCSELTWPDRKPGVNVIIIVNDTMRRDRMEVHNGTAKTPAFDQFSRENLLFERAYTQSPWTKPSVATLFTSLYPSQHGVVSHPELKIKSGKDPNRPGLSNDVLSKRHVTIAESLQEAGFHTAAIVANPWLKKEYGFAQGFETYDDVFATDAQPGDKVAQWKVPGSEVTERAINWLNGIQSGQRFFLYLHYIDTHRPYTIGADEVEARADEIRNDSRQISSRTGRVIGSVVRLPSGRPAVSLGVPATLSLLEHAYDRGIEAFDEHLREFLSYFSSHQEFDKTAIIVTSDHGEALFTRGYGNHGYGLYEDEVAIPFAARLPGVNSERNRVQTPVGLIDIMPTLCTYLDVDLPGSIICGRSLLALADSKESRQQPVIVAEGVMGKPSNRAIIHGRYKALWQPVPGPDQVGHALFNLQDDASEGANLIGSTKSTDRFRETFDRLVRLARTTVSSVENYPKEYVPIDPEQLRRLRSLGYID
ncbi:MAG: hypothetical protein CMJ62_19900 [Planctomycetaceae bacterium]|nr:hypothetical protein [Planctomycetaceae bacterium]